MNDGDVYLFTDELNNFGEAYDPLTGVFTCPLNAYYLFSVALTAYDNEHIHGNILLEGDVIASAMSGQGNFNQGSNLVVLPCNAGQRVWVEAYFDSNYWSHRYRTSSFSGTLLQLNL